MDYVHKNALYTGSLRIKNIIFLSREIYPFISGAELKWLTVLQIMWDFLQSLYFGDGVNQCPLTCLCTYKWVKCINFLSLVSTEVTRKR